MAVTVKSVKKCEEISDYVPHRWRSHPFYFIGLPLYLILTTIFYWIIWVPLCYSLLFDNLGPYAAEWTVPFFIIVFIGYLFIVAAYLYEWRCRHKNQELSYYEITEDKCELEESPVDSVSYEMTPMNTEKCDVHFDKPPSPKIPKKRPQTLHLEESRPVSQNLHSPLTPRELFFIDLIEAATQQHEEPPEGENQDYSYSPPHYSKPFHGFDHSPGNSSGYATFSPTSPHTEYFIANIPENKNCKSEVFLFVDDEDKKDCKVIEVVMKNDAQE